jgi:hypothetical protein
MKTSFIIFVSSAIRQFDFCRVEGFKHTSEFTDVPYQGRTLGERYVYLGRELTLEEFNEAAAKIFATGFRGEERTFQPLAIVRSATAAKPPAPAPVVEPDPTPEPDEASTPPAFTLDGKAILLGDERVAGLFGDDKQLRVTAAYTDLRPQIEAWLLTLTPSES